MIVFLNNVFYVYNEKSLPWWTILTYIVIYAGKSVYFEIEENNKTSDVKVIKFNCTKPLL